MGTFGFSRVEIIFSKELPVAFKSEENMLEHIDAGLTLHEFEASGLNVWFEISSGRLSNLDHQVKQVVRYIRDKKLEVQEINCSGYSESDYGSFQYNSGDGELHEFELGDI